MVVVDLRDLFSHLIYEILVLVGRILVVGRVLVILAEVRDGSLAEVVGDSLEIFGGEGQALIIDGVLISEPAVVGQKLVIADESLQLLLGGEARTGWGKLE